MFQLGAACRTGQLAVPACQTLTLRHLSLVQRPDHQARSSKRRRLGGTVGGNSGHPLPHRYHSHGGGGRGGGVDGGDGGAMRVTWLGIGVNATFGGLKLGTGILAGSAALVADAVRIRISGRFRCPTPPSGAALPVRIRTLCCWCAVLRPSGRAAPLGQLAATSTARLQPFLTPSHPASSSSSSSLPPRRSPRFYHMRTHTHITVATCPAQSPNLLPRISSASLVRSGSLDGVAACRTRYPPQRCQT